STATTTTQTTTTTLEPTTTSSTTAVPSTSSTTTTESTTTTTLACTPNAGTFLLGFQSGGGEPLALSLDRASLHTLIAAAELRTHIVGAVDLTSAVTSAIAAFKNACGTGWKLDQSDPQFDCSLTPLGQTFVGADGTARTSPEFALLRVLDMTPAN